MHKNAVIKTRLKIFSIHSDEQRQTSIIDPEYEEDIKRKVSEVFGENNMENVYKEIEELLKDEKMVTCLSLNICVMVTVFFKRHIKQHLIQTHNGFLCQTNIARKSYDI